MNLSVSAREAAGMAGQDYGAAKNARRQQEVLPDILEVSNEKRIYIFNVGPWQLEQLLGSSGSWRLNPCPEGKEYSEPLIVPGIHITHYPADELEMKMFQEPGQNLADAIMGIGKMMSPSNSWKKYGVFQSKSNPPTKKAIDDAKAELGKYYDELIAEASLAAAQGPKMAEQTITDRHLIAARARKKTVAECPWIANSAVSADRQPCEACGTIYEVGKAIVCSNCKYIIDEARYAKMKTRFAS